MTRLTAALLALTLSACAAEAGSFDPVDSTPPPPVEAGVTSDAGTPDALQGDTAPPSVDGGGTVDASPDVTPTLDTGAPDTSPPNDSGAPDTGHDTGAPDTSPPVEAGPGVCNYAEVNSHVCGDPTVPSVWTCENGGPTIPAPSPSVPTPQCYCTTPDEPGNPGCLLGATEWCCNFPYN